MPSIKEKKLIYHLTHFQNLASIFANGLLPRAQLTQFRDVADHEIIADRAALRLEHHVPFHWFAGSPFDGIVQKTHRGELFVLIAVSRDLARLQNWKVVPRHPLANEVIELLDYAPGFQAINWEKMEARDYHDPESKSVCMAECLAPGLVPPGDFNMIFTPSEESKAQIDELQKQFELNLFTKANAQMFVR
jgi:hypothetical protein